MAKNKPSLFGTIKKLSDARGALDNKKDDDQGIGSLKSPNLVPTDSTSIAYGRTTGEVLNIVYLITTTKPVSKGGFHPNGSNGGIKTSAAK